MSEPSMIEDTLALLALMSDYAAGADSFSGERYAEAFTPDGVLDATGIGLSEVAGRKAIAALMDNAFRQQTHNFHLVSNQRVGVIDGDRATGWSYFLQKSVLRNGGRTEMSGRYDDVYQRTADGWKIARRTLVPLLPVVLEGYQA